MEWGRNRVEKASNTHEKSARHTIQSATGAVYGLRLIAVYFTMKVLPFWM